MLLTFNAKNPLSNSTTLLRPLPCGNDQLLDVMFECSQYGVTVFTYSLFFFYYLVFSPFVVGYDKNEMSPLRF